MFFHVLEKSLKPRIALVHFTSQPSVSRGAGYILGSLLEGGYSVDFMQTSSKWGAIQLKEIAHRILSSECQILFLSSFTMFFPEVLRLARFVKSQRQIITVLGGIHATLEGGKILETHSEIDFLCLGEGESFALEFMEKLGQISFFSIKNLGYRSNNRVILNSCRPAENLANLPLFPWNHFSKDQIIDYNGFLAVHATRGCPFLCSYCCNHAYINLYGNSYIRFRPIEKIIEEMVFLKKKFSPQLFYFGDEMLLSNIEYFRRLAKSIKKEIDVPFGCMARVEYLSQEVVDWMEESGCKYVGIGVECGDEHFRRKFLNRHMTNQQIISAFGYLKKAKISATSFNIIGFPFENDDKLTLQTEQLTNILSPNFAQFSIFFPFPGTKLFEYCLQQKLIDWKKYRRTRNYYSESVLKNRKVKHIRDVLDRKFNKKEPSISFSEMLERGKQFFRETIGKSLVRLTDI